MNEHRFDLYCRDQIIFIPTCKGLLLHHGKGRGGGGGVREHLDRVVRSRDPGTGLLAGTRSSLLHGRDHNASLIAWNSFGLRDRAIRTYLASWSAFSCYRACYMLRRISPRPLSEARLITLLITTERRLNTGSSRLKTHWTLCIFFPLSELCDLRVQILSHEERRRSYTELLFEIVCI